MLRIAIISDNDRIWSLAVWERTLPFLKDHHREVAGFWNCPAKISKLKPNEVLLWYVKTFGAYTFFKLGCFAAFARIARYINYWLRVKPKNFCGLCERENIEHYRCTGPNDPAFIHWVKDHEIDIVIITVGHILQEDVLKAPRIGVINKHAALLPANKGIFPYFWAFLKGEQQGISFHEVVRGIDEGRLLVQEIVPVSYTESMIQFYVYVFDKYPAMLLQAIENLVKGEFRQPISNLPSSYHGLPARSDYRQFARQGGQIVTWSDLLLALKL